MTSTADAASTRTGASPRAAVGAAWTAVRARLGTAVGVLQLGWAAVWRVVGPVLTVISPTGWVVLAIAVAAFVLQNRATASRFG
ncbi:MAG: hypothetical protein ABW004_08800, partial [Aeromicrobium sp.]